MSRTDLDAATERRIRSITGGEGDGGAEGGSAPILAVLVDVEGTTTAIDFVRTVLFADARARLAEYVAGHGEDREVRACTDALASAATAEGRGEDAIAFALRCIDEDRKLGPLKRLQGRIWEDGYRAGRFRGHVYDDVPAQLRDWQARGVLIYVYSSGSVAAQRLLFGHSEAGDLLGLFAGHFDTDVGPKNDPESYRKIAAAMGMPPESVLFLSDAAVELDAAVDAGMRAIGLARDGSAPPAAREGGHEHWWVSSFGEIDV